MEHWRVECNLFSRERDSSVKSFKQKSLKRAASGRRSRKQWRAGEFPVSVS